MSLRAELPNVSLQNPSVANFAMAETQLPIEFAPGGIKSVKLENKRNDSAYWMEPGKLTVVPGVNLRSAGPKREARVRELADDMKLNGFRHDCPISCLVLDDGAGGSMIVPYNGGTRLDAVQLANTEGAGIDRIPVILAPKTMSLDDVYKAQVKCNNGEPFHMLEVSAVVKKLHERGFSPAEIAHEFSYTSQHVDNLLVLAAAPKAICNMIASDQVSATHAVNEIRRHGAERATKLLQQALADAQANGKTKIKPKDAPVAVFRSALKKNSTKLFERALLIQEDPAYHALQESTRLELDALLQELKAVRPAEEATEA